MSLLSYIISVCTPIASPNSKPIMTKITLPKAYVAVRCRAIINQIDDMRRTAVRAAFEAKCAAYYGRDWLDFPANLYASAKRIYHGWPEAEPIGTDDEIINFITAMPSADRRLTAHVYGAQYGTCLTLLHAATIDESEAYIEVDLTGYECIADANHEVRKALQPT